MFEESIWWTSMNSWLTPTVLFVLLNLMIGTIAISSSLAKSQKSQQKINSDQLAGYLLHQNIPEPEQEQTSFFRSLSVLHRLKSIGRQNEPSQELDQEPTSVSSYPSVLQRLKSIGRNSSETESDKEQSSFFRSPSVLQRLKSIGRYNSQTWTPENEPAPESANYEIDADELRSMDEIYSQLKSGGGGNVTRSNSDTVPNAGAKSKPVKLAKKMKKSASAKSAFAHFEEVETIEARRPATVREVRVSAKDQDDDEEVDSKADDFINKFKQNLKLQRLN